MTFKISILGPLNIDLIIRGNAPTNLSALNQWADLSDVTCLTAGAAGYVSQNLKKLGNEIHLVSCIGDDPFGEMILSSLRKIGINHEYILIEEGKQGAIAIFMLLFGSNKRPLTYRLPTHHGWPPKIDDKMKEYLLDSDLFHSAGYLHFPDLWTDDILNLYKKAKSKGIHTSMDPQFPLTPRDPPWIDILKPLIPYIDILMVDENEAINLTGKEEIKDAAEMLYNEGFKIIAIKLGAKGVLIKDEKHLEKIPAIPPKEFIDSIGAGDSFDAGFLQGYLEGHDIVSSAKMGVMTATMSIEGIGGTETFPKRENLVI
jgi:sugar/nucleoside kinase (ribokinase family)